MEALRDTDRDGGIDLTIVRQFSNYREFVHQDYAGFESDLRFGASEVYLHEMPGGQFTNADHVPALMPGVVASVAVTEGQMITSGDLLLTIEAMKMETALHADRDGTIQKTFVQPGTKADAKDLLICFGK